MPSKNRIKYFLNRFGERIFEDRLNCVLCDNELQSPSRSGLCPQCARKVRFNDGKICLKCGAFQPDESDYCIECQNRERAFDFARSAAVYDENVAKLVYGLKFGDRKYLAKYMAATMSDVFLREEIDADYIVPVPLSKKRLKSRGYNQAEEIGKSLSVRLGVPICRALERVRETRMQARESAAKRRENLEGAFALKDGVDIRDADILLVDDVMTTGATAEAAVSALRKGFPASVKVLTFASVYKKIYGEKN